MPVTPARNRAVLTSGSRSGRTMAVMSFIVCAFLQRKGPPPKGSGPWETRKPLATRARGRSPGDDPRQVRHQPVGVVVLLDPAGQDYEDVTPSRGQLHDRRIVVHHAADPSGLVEHLGAGGEPRGNALGERSEE